MEGAVLSGKLCAKQINDLSRQLKAEGEQEKAVAPKEAEVIQAVPTFVVIWTTALLIFDYKNDLICYVIYLLKYGKFDFDAFQKMSNQPVGIADSHEARSTWWDTSEAK